MTYLGISLLQCLVLYISTSSGRFLLQNNEPNHNFMNHSVSAPRCPCKDKSLCNRIETKAKNEVYIFGGIVNDQWYHYDYDKISTIVEHGDHVPERLCLAHAHGVRFVRLVDYPTNLLPDAAHRSLWVDWMISNVTAYFYDGLNVDFEGDIPIGRFDLRDGLTRLVQELSGRLRVLYPHTQISFDFSCEPRDRWYDYIPITDVSDFVFLMDYGEPSLSPYAGANSNFSLTLHGVLEFIKYGLDPSKIIIGVPWYGVMYNCSSFDLKTEHCVSPHGTTVSYDTIVRELLPQSFSGRMWDKKSKSPFANFKDPITGAISQLWYDDMESLDQKYAMAKLLGLRGVGVWQASHMNYSDPQQIKDLWGHFPYTYSSRGLDSTGPERN